MFGVAGFFCALTDAQTHLTKRNASVAVMLASVDMRNSITSTTPFLESGAAGLGLRPSNLHCGLCRLLVSQALLYQVTWRIPGILL